MEPKIQKFIEKYIKLIENNDFEKLYDRWTTLVYNSRSGKIEGGDLTKILMEARIDPLPYFYEIPRFYLDCKGGWWIDLLHIPSNVKRLGFYCFHSCCRIDKLVLPTSIEYIGLQAFDNTNIGEIQYEGTMSQFKNLLMWSHSDPGNKLNIVHCSDGVYTIEE